MKARIDTSSWGEQRLVFHCPGCGCLHSFRLADGNLKRDPQRPIWKWNGSLDKPSLEPSLIMYSLYSVEERQRLKVKLCHLYLTDGVIIFLNDCEHDLKSRKVALADGPDV